MPKILMDGIVCFSKQKHFTQIREIKLTHFMTSREPSKDGEIPNLLSSLPKTHTKRK
jgi:hypothetical protein